MIEKHKRVKLRELTPVQRFKRAEERLNKVSTLAFDKWYFNPHMTLESFFSQFFTLNGLYDTCYANNKKFQCEIKRYRTLGDIYRITKTYFPEVRLVDVLKFLTESVINKKCYTQVCCNILKRTYAPTIYRQSDLIYDKERNDGFGNKWAEYELILKELL